MTSHHSSTLPPHAENNPDYSKRISETEELIGYSEPREALRRRVPQVPQALLWEFASDVAVLLSAYFPAGTVQGELLDDTIYLLTYGNDPIRFARAATLYERLGGVFNRAFDGSIDTARENIAKLKGDTK